MNISGFELPSTLPRPFTLRHLVQNYLDINSIPRRSFFEFLAYFTDSDLEKEKLMEFCTADGLVNETCMLCVCVCVCDG